MTSILRCISVLKIPYKFTIKPVLSKCCLVHYKKLSTQKFINRSLSVGAWDCIIPMYMKHFGGNLKEDLTKPFLLTPLSTCKMRRSIGTKVSSKKLKPCRQADNKEKSKRDETCSEECITVTFGKAKKKVKKDDIKFIVNLNDVVHGIVKNHACRKMEQTNKLRNFIFKPTNCTSCMQNERSNDKFDQQKRSFSLSTDNKKMFLNNITRKSELRQFGLPSRNEKNFYPFFTDNKIPDKQTMFISDSSDFTKGGIVPLYLLVKSSSRRNKTLPSVTINFQYRVGTNHAFVPLEQKKLSGNISQDSKKYILSPTKSNDSFFTNSTLTGVNKDTSKIFKPTNEVKSKLQEHFLKPLSENSIYSEEKKRKNEELNTVLVDTVKKFLIPLLQKEQLKYSEVKKAIERLDKKMESYLEKQSTIPEGNINRSLSNLYNLLMKQNQSDSKKEKIKDPCSHTEIREPTLSKDSVKDPHILNCSITLPPLSRNNISEPCKNNTIFECKNVKGNKEDFGGTYNSCNKLDSHCKNENNESQKTNHCQETKDHDQCKKYGKNEGKKPEHVCKERDAETTCIKEKKTEETCKKQDPCQKIEADIQKFKTVDEIWSKPKHENGDPCGKMLKPKYHDIFLKKEVKNPEHTCETAAICKSEVACTNDAVHNCSVKESKCSTQIQGEVTEIYRKKDKPCTLEVADVSVSGKNDTCEFVERKPPCILIQKESHPSSQQLDRKCKSQSSSESKLTSTKKSQENNRMGPSEVICEKKELFSQKDCCKEEKICEKTSIKVIEPKCLGNQHVPMTDDGKSSPHEKENLSTEKYVPTPVQKPCGAHCHEPSEPPNCCKTRPSIISPACTLQENIQQIKEIPSVKQTACPRNITPEKTARKLEETYPPSTPPSSTKESFFNYPKKDPDLQKLKSRQCVYGKTSDYDKEKPKVIIKKTVPEHPRPPKLQANKIREPQQSQKKSWLPFRLKFAKRKLKNSRSIPTTNCPPKQDKPNDRNVVIDNCKGFLRNVWGVFCPGKSKPKKKTDGIIRCHSLPSMMPTEMNGPSCVLPGSSDNGRSTKKIRFFIYNMKVQNKYPWNKTQQEVSKYFTTNFSTNSNGINRMPGGIHRLDTSNFEMQRNITKKYKSKSMVFRIVLQKNVSGFTTDPFGNKNIPQCFRYLKLLESQKRNYSNISAKKLTFKKGTPHLWDRNIARDKSKRINQYTWRKIVETWRLLYTYQCYITKKFFELISCKLGKVYCNVPRIQPRYKPTLQSTLQKRIFIRDLLFLVCFL